MFKFFYFLSNVHRKMLCLATRWPGQNGRRFHPVVGGCCFVDFLQKKYALKMTKFPQIQIVFNSILFLLKMSLNFSTKTSNSD